MRSGQIRTIGRTGTANRSWMRTSVRIGPDQYEIEPAQGALQKQGAFFAPICRITLEITHRARSRHFSNVLCRDCVTTTF